MDDEMNTEMEEAAADAAEAVAEALEDAKVASNLVEAVKEEDDYFERAGEAVDATVSLPTRPLPDG